MIIASVLGAFSVALGAFGAHALKPMLEARNRMDTYETAVKYQFYHVLALLIAGFLLHKFVGNTWFAYAGYSFIAGMTIFSGSLYILCISGVTKWGAVTPIGGVLLIAGWVLMAIGLSKL